MLALATGGPRTREEAKEWLPSAVSLEGEGMSMDEAAAMEEEAFLWLIVVAAVTGYGW